MNSAGSCLSVHVATRRTRPFVVTIRSFCRLMSASQLAGSRWCRPSISTINVRPSGRTNSASVYRHRPEASRRRAAVVPAHYAGHGGATIVARGDRFMVDDWLNLSLA